MDEKYNKLMEKFIEEFPKVSKDIIENKVKKGLEDGRLPLGIKHDIIEKTGAIPISELEKKEYYMANNKLYSLSKAKMVYKASPVTEYYISENGNYFAVELINPGKSKKDPLSKDNIKKIIDLTESDMIDTLMQKNEIILLATEFPEVFHSLEEA